MTPLIGSRNDELTFKVNLENRTRFLFLLEEPDLTRFCIEFCNEHTTRCSMTSSKSSSDPAKIKLSYEIGSDSICITYWPTLVGFYTLNVTSSG